jgi:PEP-CTERM motif-containing protein
MRALNCAAILAVLIVAAPAAARTATLTEDFTIDISGPDSSFFLSTPFAKFDPSLGTLTEISEKVTGTTTLTTEFGLPPTLQLSLSLLPAVQHFSSEGVINIDLTGASTDAARLANVTGEGTTNERLVTEDATAIGIFAPATLDGEITYQYNAIPEASTWAMIVMGFAGLAFARRIRAAAFARSV